MIELLYTVHSALHNLQTIIEAASIKTYSTEEWICISRGLRLHFLITFSDNLVAMIMWSMVKKFYFKFVHICVYYKISYCHHKFHLKPSKLPMVEAKVLKQYLPQSVDGDMNLYFCLLYCWDTEIKIGIKWAKMTWNHYNMGLNPVNW